MVIFRTAMPGPAGIAGPRGPEAVPPELLLDDAAPRGFGTYLRSLGDLLPPEAEASLTPGLARSTLKE